MKRNITDLRESLFEAMDMLKKGTIDVATAKAMSELGQVIVNTAKAETEFIDKYGGSGSGFIPAQPDGQKKIERPPAEYSNSGHLATVNKYS